MEPTFAINYLLRTFLIVALNTKSHQFYWTLQPKNAQGIFFNKACIGTKAIAGIWR